MTVRELFNNGKNILEQNSVENFQNEARWIFESVFKCKSEYLIIHSSDFADKILSEEFISKINQRASGVPVQYVIGEWDFYGETFFVGDGVLIPRPETELLVDFALEFLKNKTSPVVIDLCSGTGCIGLTVARLLPNAKVFMIEKSDKAFSYLEKNKEKFSLDNAIIIQGDIFDGFEKSDIPEPDLILSNPPYINSDEIASLQAEVLREPAMALDGGTDGLDFYKAISDKWLNRCKGAIAVECGEGQADDIRKFFSQHCSGTSSVLDFNEIERVVIGRKEI